LLETGWSDEEYEPTYTTYLYDADGFLEGSCNGRTTECARETTEDSVFAGEAPTHWTRSPNGVKYEETEYTQGGNSIGFQDDGDPYLGGVASLYGRGEYDRYHALGQ
jgi:hypothetical protein